MKYGYIRVSTKEQNIDRQLTAMEEEGIGKRQLYIDKSSGKDFNRTAYRKLLRCLKKGDELVIKSIDRLGRNYAEIIEQWNYLVKKRGVDIKVLDFSLLNTKSGIDNLTGRLISDLVLQVLSYVAQMERESMLQRQKEGIWEAKKKGIRFGHPTKPSITEYIDDPDLPEGTEEEVTPGKEGSVTITTTYTLDPKTGKVTSNTSTSETPMEKRLVRRGTKKQEVPVTPDQPTSSVQLELQSHRLM